MRAHRRERDVGDLRQREHGGAIGAQGEGIPAQSDAQDGEEDGEDIDIPFAHTVDKGTVCLAHEAKHQQGAEQVEAARGQPDQVQVVQEVRGDGLAHGPPNNIPHSKCNYNEEWDGWRPMYVCRKMNRAYKEREDCKE